MKSILLYYPFKMAKEANSGSKLRPKEMYKAFQQWGKSHHVEVLLLSGDSKEREQTFDEWKAEGKLDDLLFCYMENQTIPFWLTDAGHIPKKPFVDQKVMKFLKSRDIPVGVFYRDVYWKFEELYPLKGIKKTIMKSIYRLEEKFYEKYCEVIFLPSDAMGAYVDIHKQKVALPPGGKERDLTNKNGSVSEVAKGLYVGGINNEDYGLFLLLDALEKANKDHPVCDLTVVCRQDEYDQLDEAKKSRLQKMNISVKHLSGEPLNQLYQEVDFAFIPRYKSTYNDFSVPVKLVEYLSNELPIVATNCEAQKEIIESDGYGIICQDQAEDMAKAIVEMAANVSKYRDHIQATFIKKHSWVSRAEQVSEALCKEEL